MKLKKYFTAIVISILILFVGNSIFATNEKSDNVIVSENKVTNSVNNEVKNEVSNKVENEVNNETEDNSKNEVDDSVLEDETESGDEVTSDEIEDDDIIYDFENELGNDEISSDEYDEIIEEDIVKVDVNENLVYKNSYIEGNIFIMSTKKVTLDNVDIAGGDVFIFADKVEIKDSTILGNVYVMSDELTLEKTGVFSIYSAVSSKTNFDTAVILREARLSGKDVVINSIIERDLYVFAEDLKISDKSIVLGDLIARSETKEISEKARIDGKIDYEKVNFSNESTTSENIITYLIEKGTEIAIIVLIAIFLLCGFPKFVEVNSSLRLRDFFKSFFTGLLEFLVIIAIAVGLFMTGYGAGYGLILLNLLFIFAILGKIIFMISFAIRLSCKPEKVSRVRAFFATVGIALVVDVIEMISLIGTVGIIIDVVINIVLALVGLGSIFKVIFTSKKKITKLANIKTAQKTNKPEYVQQEYVAPVQEEPKEEIKEEDIDLKSEIKKEINEEIKELKEEREEEKKLEESDSPKTEEAQEEKNEPKEEKIDEDKKEDDDKEDK